VSDTVSLSRLTARRPSASFAPLGQGIPAATARERIGDFLLGAYGVPDELVANRLETLSLPERVFLEIEMTEREKRLHTFDYDPLMVP